MDTREGTEADEKTRISKARAAFHNLRHVWKSRVIGKTTKIRLFNTIVKSVLLNRTDMPMAVAQYHTENQCLWKFLEIEWIDQVSNKDIWERTSIVQIDIDILKRRWGWHGHTLRKPSSYITR